MQRVTIERLGHLGDGVAAGPVFVPRVLPGEVVEGVIDGNRMASPRIVTPTADRISPPCKHYRGCGGCALQHARDDFVAGWKVGVVKNALQAHGLGAPIRNLHTSPPGSRRRATFSGRRTKKGALVGFHAPGSETVTPIPDCRILRAELLSALPALEELTSVGATRKGELKLAVTVTTTGLDVSVTGGRELSVDLRQSQAAFVEANDIARVSWDGDTVAARRAPILKFGRVEVPIPPGAFLQATEEGEAALSAAVTETVGDAKAVGDLFSGVGTFSLRLAENSEVHAVEGADDLLAALDQGWRHAKGLRLVTHERRDLFRRPLTPDALDKFEAVVIDPPRAGAEAQSRELAASGVRRIAAISCNPVTFARDAAILKAGGYQLDWIDVVDQFRWSPHVELAAQFTRA